MSNPIVTVDEDSLKGELHELVRKTAQDTINALLDEEAAEMVGAERYERTAEREAYRSGHYKRKLTTTAGEVELDVPKLRGATFQTAVIERYRRRETSVEEAIIEMYLAGVAARRCWRLACGASGNSENPATQRSVALGACDSGVLALGFPPRRLCLRGAWCICVHLGDRPGRLGPCLVDRGIRRGRRRAGGCRVQCRACVARDYHGRLRVRTVWRGASRRCGSLGRNQAARAALSPLGEKGVGALL